MISFKIRSFVNGGINLVFKRILILYGRCCRCLRKDFSKCTPKGNQLGEWKFDISSMGSYITSKWHILFSKKLLVLTKRVFSLKVLAYIYFHTNFHLQIHSFGGEITKNSYMTPTVQNQYPHKITNFYH